MIRARIPEPQHPDPHTGMFSLGCPACGGDDVTAGPNYHCPDCGLTWTTSNITELIRLVHQHRRPVLKRAA